MQSEVRRRDDDSEQRRQEIHRLREQNHGYQERLQKAKVESQPLPAQLSSPVLSPSHSRPNSFLSVSSSSDHHDDDPGNVNGIFALLLSTLGSNRDDFDMILLVKGRRL